MRAGLTAFDMTAQRRGSAALDRRHDLELAEAQVAGMGGTPSWPVVAEDVRHLDRRPWQRPRSAGHLQQEVEWAGHLANRADRDAGVERRRVELLVSEQNLDDPDIGFLLQEMGGKAVPQRVNTDPFGNAGTSRCQANDPVELARTLCCPRYPGNNQG